MDKLAELVRDVEVRGVLGACVHSGVLPELSPEGFDKLAADVSAKIGDDENYTIDSVMQAAADVLNESAEKTASEAPAEEVEEKLASDEDIDAAVHMALGEVFLQKLANEIDDETFVASTESILKEAADLKKEVKKVVKEVKKSLPSAKEVKKIVVEGAKGKDIVKAVSKGDAKLLAKAMGRTGVVYAAPTAALAAAVEQLAD